MDGDEVERQLELAWQTFTPPRGLRGHVRSQLAATGVVPLSPPQGLAGAAVPSGWRALRASGKHGLGLGAALLAAGFLMGRVTTTGQLGEPASSPSASEWDRAREVMSPQPASSLPLPAPPPKPEPLASEKHEAPEQRSTRESKTAPPRAPAPPRAAPKRSAQRDWRGELELLERAERAVRADNAALALALLDEHGARYPESVLTEERRAIELMAYCQARATDGSARATRFLAEYPSSVYADRVIDLCKLDSVTSGKGLSTEPTAEGSSPDGH